MNRNLSFVVSLFFILITNSVFGQFAPVVISGFNHDVVAESGNSSLTTTTSALDGITVSNKVIYTSTFRTLNGFAGGGIPDNGVITDGGGSYQLADFTANNALIIPRSQSGDLTLTTPASFNKVRLLAFSTEGTSLLNINLFFADGSSSTGVSNYALGDWFNGNLNLVISGIGRCTRATPASGADAFPSNPRMYFIEIGLSCADRQKSLQRINISNVTTAGNNAPYPNAVFFAVSGTSFNQSISSSTTDATCSVGGTATITATGSGAPFNVSWNTIPPQTGLTATNLAEGSYVATITDVNGCINTQNVSIVKNNDLLLTANADTSVCFGATFSANTNSNAAAYSWSPANAVSNASVANPVLSPVGPVTAYSVTATLGSCTSTASFNVTVAAELVLTTNNPISVCTGGSFTANTTSNAANYSWTPVTGLSNATIANPVVSPTSTTTYTVTASTGLCSISGTFTVTVVPPVTANAGNDVIIANGQTVQLVGSGSAGAVLWTPSTGLSATNILNPIASPTENTTYTITITTPEGCTASDNVIIEVNSIPNCATPMNAITPNGDGINDRWIITTGNCVLAAKVRIFNRYGSPVFTAENYQNNWEGTYKGKPVPVGTYYYVIEYRLPNGSPARLNGNVTVLR